MSILSKVIGFAVSINKIAIFTVEFGFSLMDPASPSSTKLYQISLIYSKRKASIGFKFDAFFAGYHPKNIPMAEQTRNESTTDCVIITTGQPINDPMTCLLY